MLDRRGVKIHEDDWVIWLSRGSHGDVGPYRVLNLGSGKRVKLEVGGWVVPTNVVVVAAMPLAAGRNIW